VAFLAGSASGRKRFASSSRIPAWFPGFAPGGVGRDAALADYSLDNALQKEAMSRLIILDWLPLCIQYLWKISRREIGCQNNEYPQDP
jgi:hypothetical protein